MPSSPVVRFAPSPSGRLHLGNARVALLNWLRARGHGGRFLLRFDDTDQCRASPELMQGIRDDLTWLGLTWDEELRQSGRHALYQEAAERLKASGRLYACYETETELALKRKSAAAAGRPPIYDRAALALSAADHRAYQEQGQRPHWRFLLDPAPCCWEDLVRGAQTIDPQHVSDPVLIRGDGCPLYTLSSVVDDLACGINEIVRGADHVTNTAVQIQIFAALGADPESQPRFAHVPLLLDKEGHSLSKRRAALSLEGLRGQGVEPRALSAVLRSLGSSNPPDVTSDPQLWAQSFTWQEVGRAAVHFDHELLTRSNARYLRHLSYAQVRARLQDLDCDGGEDFWNTLRSALTYLPEIKDWHACCTQELLPPPPAEDSQDEASAEEHSFYAQAAALLPDEPWDRETWTQWCQLLKEKTQRQGRALFAPLRLALTGRRQGPELRDLLPLIGRQRAQARLKARPRSSRDHRGDSPAVTARDHRHQP